MAKNIIRKVKRSITNWEKTSAVYITNKKLISPIHQELLKCKDGKVMKNPMEKWTM